MEALIGGVDWITKKWLLDTFIEAEGVQWEGIFGEEMDEESEQLGRGLRRDAQFGAHPGPGLAGAAHGGAGTRSCSSDYPANQTVWAYESAPPSARNSAPVQYELSSQARKRTSRAISSGRPVLPNGTR